MGDVLQKLTEEASVPAKPNFRFSTTQVKLITYMMDKHGSDYKAMSRDPKNHYQETPARLRGMVTKFISIPEHYAPYCKERGLIKSEQAESPGKVTNSESGDEDSPDEEREGDSDSEDVIDVDD